MTSSAHFLLPLFAMLQVRSQGTVQEQAVTCERPPADVYTSEVQTAVEANIPALRRFAGDVSLTARRKAEKIRELLPGVYNFEVLEYTFCGMYKRGLITHEQYLGFIRQVLPIIPGANASEGVRTNTSSPVSTRPPNFPLANVDRSHLRSGLQLGWQLARFEFVDGSLFPEAQALEPELRRDIVTLLAADDFALDSANFHFREAIQAVLSHYAASDLGKHAAILVGIAAFRSSLIGASSDESHNLQIRSLARSAIQEIDPAMLPEKSRFFDALVRAKPMNIVSLLSFIDSIGRR